MAGRAFTGTAKEKKYIIEGRSYMKRVFIILASVAILLVFIGPVCAAPDFKLGNEVFMSNGQYHKLIEGKRIGLITNQSGVTSTGESMIDLLANDSSTRLVALYGPEHGIDGTARAGEYVQSYIHPELDIPVYSLYGPNRMPTGEMLEGVDMLIFDIQDIGARTYTYKSTLNYCMVAAEKYNKKIIVLDRPNPVGGTIVAGPVLEDPFKSFVGIDNLPMAHGMTIGELAKYFNRKIGADLTVVPMEGYGRKMIYQDTGLNWVATSPNIPDIESVFGYMATGLGEGTGIRQRDTFNWIGGKGINSAEYARLLNGANLPGVRFIADPRGEEGGVKLDIFDFHKFNPAKTGIYALTYAHRLTGFKVPKSGAQVVMFDKVMGTDKFGRYLEQGLTPQQIESKFAPALEEFKKERTKYLIYGDEPGDYRDSKGSIIVLVNGNQIEFDASPYIDQNNRTMVPLRAILEALGAKVDWDAQTRGINIVRQGERVRFALNDNTAVVNGEVRIMDTTPVIKNSRTMVPLRYIGEYFGAGVDWNPSLRAVKVNTR